MVLVHVSRYGTLARYWHTSMGYRASGLLYDAPANVRQVGLNPTPSHPPCPCLQASRQVSPFAPRGSGHVPHPGGAGSGVWVSDLVTGTALWSAS